MRDISGLNGRHEAAPTGPTCPAPAERVSPTGRSIAVLIALVLCLVSVPLLPSSAFAAETVGPLEVSCASDGTVWAEGSMVELAVMALNDVKVTCTPSSIEVGISCGMDDMCGLDPCLCGTPDAYGCCACNGFEEISPDVTMSSSNVLVACPVRIFESWHVVSLVPGEADITVTGTLLHYEDSVVAFHVESGVRSAANVAVGIVLLVVVVAIVVLVVRRLRCSRSADETDGEGGAR